MLTVVMYHYVRDAHRTAYPGIKARSRAEFEAQLDYIERHYAVVRSADVVASYNGGAALPPNACLLTFDDGLVDHAETVLPALRRRGLAGCFSPPARPVLERRVLDVQKSQFVLAAGDDHRALANRVLDLLQGLRSRHHIPSDDELRRRFARPGRYDGADTILVKRLLQDGLPDAPRRAVLDELFTTLVTHDEEAFADELYLSLDDVHELAEAGMDIGGHGYEHHRLGLLGEEVQRAEIDRTQSFLRLALGNDPADWTMCYPYGDRSELTLLLLAEAGCALGLTTDVGLATPASSPLELPRLDTNDLPCAGDAQANDWTRSVLGEATPSVPSVADGP